MFATEFDPGNAAPSLRESRGAWLPALGWNDVFDRGIALIAIIFLAPVMLVIAVAIAIFDPGPVLFRHRRIGAGGKIFECLKFRSMVVDSDARLNALLQTCAASRAEWACHQKLQRDPRITPLGRFLRKSSLDELPQLFNVLFGEMSLIGPRPIVAAEIVRYGHYFRYYTGVRPGVTGLWQVSGRNNVSYRRRVAMDVIYTRRRTFSLNMQILAKTIPAVITSRGCN